MPQSGDQIIIRNFDLMKSDKKIQSHDRKIIGSPEKVNFDLMKFNLLKMTKNSNNKLKTEKEKDRTRQQLKFQRKKERRNALFYFKIKCNFDLST